VILEAIICPVEFEYLRHGTQALIASLNVASGRIAQADVGERRTEADADLDIYIRALLAQHPDAPKIHLVMGCLNTHQGEALVRIDPPICPLVMPPTLITALKSSLNLTTALKLSLKMFKVGQVSMELYPNP
jgi:hypothetical protein